jgi:hypothetical protein
MPEGVSHKGVFGEADEERSLMQRGRAAMNAPTSTVNIGAQPKREESKRVYKSGVGGGVGSGDAAPIVKDKVDGKPVDQDSPRQQAASKFHPQVAAVVDRLKNKAQPAADEAKFVKSGKAELQVYLANTSAETLAQLKKLGFEVMTEAKGARIVIGRISIEKLDELAKLSAVVYIAPLNSN